jgi:hypothetical protein
MPPDAGVWLLGAFLSVINKHPELTTDIKQEIVWRIQSLKNPT